MSIRIFHIFILTIIFYLYILFYLYIYKFSFISFFGSLVENALLEKFTYLHHAHDYFTLLKINKLVKSSSQSLYKTVVYDQIRSK